MLAITPTQITIATTVPWTTLLDAYGPDRSNAGLYSFMIGSSISVEQTAEVLSFVVTVATFLECGDKIQAIKWIRPQTGWTLNETKEFIDLFEKQIM